MTENMTHSQPEIHAPMKLKEYAASLGVHPRTVRTWLDDGELPSAYKDDFTGDWMFPQGTVRHQLPAEVRKQNRLRAGLEQAAQAAGQHLVVSPAKAGQGQALVQHPQFVDEAEDDDSGDDEGLTMAEKLDRAHLFLTVAEAARLLNVPRAQIHAHPDIFDAMPIGYAGSLMIPKYALRKFEGK